MSPQPSEKDLRPHLLPLFSSKFNRYTQFPLSFVCSQHILGEISQLACVRWHEIIARNCCVKVKINIAAKRRGGAYKLKCYSRLLRECFSSEICLWLMSLEQKSKLLASTDASGAALTPRWLWRHQRLLVLHNYILWQRAGVIPNPYSSPGPMLQSGGLSSGRLSPMYNNVYFCQAAHSALFQVLRFLARKWLRWWVASKNSTPRLTVGCSLQSPQIMPHCSILASFASLGNISINITALPLISCMR